MTMEEMKNLSQEMIQALEEVLRTGASAYVYCRRA